MLKFLLCYKFVILILEDLVNGFFQIVILEIDSLDLKKVDCVVLCSGKVYYDLLEKCCVEGCEDIVIVCIEQLYLFLEDDLVEVLVLYKNFKYIVWCQEELMNQGVWFCSQYYMCCVIVVYKKGFNFEYVGCEGFVVLVCGYVSMYVEQQEKLL